MIAGQVTSNDWGSRIKLGREVKCLVLFCAFSRLLSSLHGILLFLHVFVWAITAADWLAFFLVGFLRVMSHKGGDVENSLLLGLNILSERMALVIHEFCKIAIGKP